MHTKAPSYSILDHRQSAQLVLQYIMQSLRHSTDLARVRITQDIFNPGKVGARVDASLNFKLAKHK